MLRLNSVCSDFVLARILEIVRTGLSIIQIVVPILLIISGTIKFTKMMINPDEKKTFKQFINAIMSAVIVFFIPVIINLTMSAISINGDVGINENGKLTAFDIASCWNAAGYEDEYDSASEDTNITISEEESR